MKAQIVADGIVSAEKCGSVWCWIVRSDSAMIGSNCGNEVWSLREKHRHCSRGRGLVCTSSDHGAGMQGGVGGGYV